MAKRPRVCLIDDDIHVRDALALGLNDAGFDVVAAPGAAAGLDAVADGGVDAVVTDMNMPGVNGAQLIREARGRWPDLPLIAITGDSIREGRPAQDLARELGSDACLIKPFRAAQLAQALRQILSPRNG